MSARYSDAEKASALALLAANGNNLKRTARELAIPLNTLRRWRDGVGVGGVDPEMRSQKLGDLSAHFERIAHLYLTHAARPEVVSEARGKEAVTAAAIAIDKMRLLRGLPTVVVEILPAIIDRLRALGIDEGEYFKIIKEELSSVAGPLRDDDDD